MTGNPIYKGRIRGWETNPNISPSRGKKNWAPIGERPIRQAPLPPYNLNKPEGQDKLYDELEERFKKLTGRPPLYTNYTASSSKEAAKQSAERRAVKNNL